MELKLIIDCTVKFLQLLIKQYESQKISYEFFEANSKLKIRFLKDNISNIESAEQKQQIESTLEMYEKVVVTH